MRICLFTPSFLPRIGGMEIVLDHLAKQFVAMGHEVLVLAKTPADMKTPPVLPYPTAYYPRTRSQVWLLGSTRRALRREHSRRPFDVVHAHEVYPTGYVAACERKHLRVPTIVTSHAGDIGPEARYRKRWITRRRMIWAMETVDAITGVSGELKRIIDEMTGGRANAMMIPNGVDLGIEPPAEPPPSVAAIKGQTFLLSLGRLHPRKGLDVLLDALAKSRANGLQLPLLVIAGDGKERENLEQKVVSLNLREQVIFTGAVVGPAKDWLLAHCLLFCIPSRMEGMPLTVLEAMGAGKAIIGTNVSGVCELVTPGQNGLLVPPGDPESLAGAIADLLKDRAKLDRFSRSSASIARGYSWQNIAHRYLELYGSLRDGDCLRSK